jgi:restriction endonuclease S subunit
MQISTIKFSQLEDRIDAEYYKPEYLELEKVLDNSQFLGDLLLKIDRDPNFYNVGYTKTGIPLIRGLEFQPPFLELSKVEHISIETHEQFKKTEIYPKDLVMTVRGTIGKVAVVPEELKIANISPNLIFLRPKNLFQSVFLAVVLNSKIGQSQIKKIISGSVQETITVPDIESIKIPIPSQSFQKEIEKIVKESQRKRKLADEKYKKAEEILNEKLGMENLDLSTQNIFETKFSEMEDRFDPEYYQPKYKKIISKIKKQKSKLLGEIVKIRKGIEVGHEAYTDKGKPFIRVQDYNEKGITISGSTNYIRQYLYEELKKEHEPNTGEILFSKDGTVGRTFVIEKNNNEFVISGGILILTPCDIDNYYLALVLNSLVVKFQANRKSIGAIIKHLSVEEVKKLQIPILPKLTQQKISSLIQESFQLRQEAKKLIKQAKQKVERLIEK